MEPQPDDTTQLERIEAQLDGYAHLFDHPQEYRAGVHDALTAVALSEGMPEPRRPAVARRG